MSFKSPLNQVMGLGSAKEGTSHWWHQRLSALAMIPLGLWFALALLRLEIGSYQAVTAWLAAPLNAVLCSLTVTCLLYHSWLGVQVVAEDYVGSKAGKVAVLTLSSFAHVFLLAVSLFAILKIALGGS